MTSSTFSVSAAEIAALTGGRVVNASSLSSSPDSVRIQRAAPLGVATPTDIAFFFSKEYQSELATARPGILITGEPFVKPLEAAKLPWWGTAVVIACADPYLAMALISEKIAAGTSSVAHVRAPQESRIHPSAVIHPSVKLGERVQIGPFCVIEEGARIGDGTVLYPHCFVGPFASIGASCVLFADVKVYEWTVIGDRARIHSGTVIGADGFGYAPRREGQEVVSHQKIFHLGRVVIGNDVELGALVTIDRGTMGDTTIENQVKLDNQVHIGHNARVEEGAIICGGTCLAGRASVGKFAYVGGVSGIVNNVHVGDRGMVAAMTLVSKDVPPGTTVAGNPQRDLKEHFRAHAALNRLGASRSRDRNPKSSPVAAAVPAEES